jgi:sugar O-acyltransferase (sialic acid O-acetyltransferase NeuD family)
MTKNLIIIGDSLFAEIAYEYFTYDSDYDVVGFAVERAYMKRNELFGLPIIAYEDLEQHFEPSTHSFYAALVYSQLNRLRTRFFETSRSRGYSPASYISSKTFLWRNVALGEHCFICEDNTIQPFTKIEDNCVLWSGNHIGHHNIIRKNCFISSQVVISGICDIGENCFFGVNSTVGNNVDIGADCLIGAGATVTKSIPENTLIKGTQSEVADFTPRQYFKVPEPSKQA